MFTLKRPLLTLARSADERFAFMSFCALCAIAWSAFLDDGASLLLAAASVAGALAAEIITALLSGRSPEDDPSAELTSAREKNSASETDSVSASRRTKTSGRRRFLPKDASAAVSGLILALFLPGSLNPAFAAAGAFFGIAVIKLCFGGTAAPWFNPVLGGWLFIRLSWPGSWDAATEAAPVTFISTWINEVYAAGAGSPVTILAKHGFGGQNGLVITNFLNKTVFSLIKIELPEGYFDFFINPGPGIIADRGIIALIPGSIIMFAAMVNRASVSVIYLAVTAFLVRLAGALPFGGIVGGGDVFFALFSGGTLAAALFLITEPAVAPKSGAGRLVYATLAGALTWLFRYAKAESYGAVFAIALVNCLSPLIRMIEQKRRYEKPAGGPA